MENNITQHLTQLSAQRLQPESHVRYLRQLKANGFEPKVIYDIGACVLHWTTIAKEIWPNAEYVLFDAFEPAKFLYDGYKHFCGVLSDQDNKTVKFYQNDYFPGGNSYYREVGHFENLFPEDKYIVKQTRTLDSVVAEYNFPKPDFVKIDVQGAEIDIINGAVETFKDVKHMVVELQHTKYNEGAQLAEQSVPYIESLGWKCVAPLFTNSGVDGDYGFVRVK